MLSKTVTLGNPSGLHARPAAVLVALAKTFTCDVVLQYCGKSANAKSILSVLSLGASKGAELNITVNGDDEGTAINALLDAFARNLDEL